jgi:hypothetical protein
VKLPVRVLAAAVGDSSRLTRLPGFIESSFSPLAYQVAEKCLTARPVTGERAGIVLASQFGDSATADLASRLLVEGRPHNPLLFMQATPAAVLGFISKEFGITGPTLALSSSDRAGSGPLEVAADLLATGELDAVLAVGVELAPNPRVAAASRAAGVAKPHRDEAAAVLLSSGPPGLTVRTGIRGLADLARAHAADPATRGRGERSAHQAGTGADHRRPRTGGR